MKKFYKPLSVLLAITMCVSLVAPAFAQEPVQTEPTEIVQTESAQDELKVTVEDPTPETVKPPVDNDPIVEDDGDDDTIVDNDPIVEDDGDDDTIVDDVNNAPTLSSDTLAEGQSSARAPRKVHTCTFGDWENAGDHELGHCQFSIFGIKVCDETTPRDHSWGDWHVEGDQEVRSCKTCTATQEREIQLGTQTVYVYVKVTGNTADICWDNLNDNGWFTVGKVIVDGLPDPAKYTATGPVFSGAGDSNVQKAADVVASGFADRYELNKDLDLSEGVVWNELTIDTGADGYVDETTDSAYTWHLNGTLKISDKYTVTYTDGVDNETVFEDQVYSNLKLADNTPEFKVGGQVANPTREGWVFTGWKPVQAYLVLGNVTYVAQWRVKSPETPDLEVEKLAFDKTGYVPISSAQPGDTITYKIIVTNNGKTEVKNVVITDVLDSNLNFVKAEGNFMPKVWEEAPADGKYTVGTLGVTAENGGIQGAGYATLTITAKVKEGATGTIANTATADCTGMPEKKPSDTADVTVGTVNKTVTVNYVTDDATPVELGRITYELGKDSSYDHSVDATVTAIPTTGSKNAKSPKTITADGVTYAYDPTKTTDALTGTVGDSNVTINVVYSLDAKGTINGDSDTSDGIPDKYQVKVTFQVQNGRWSDGTSADKATYLVKCAADGTTYAEDGTAKLAGSAFPNTSIPLPSDGFKEDGAWTSGGTSVEVGGKDITEDTAFVFAYQRKGTMTVTAQGYEGVYDGKWHEPMASLTIRDPEGNVIELDDGKLTLSYDVKVAGIDQLEEIKDVQEMPIEITVGHKEYEIVKVNVVAKITPASLTVSTNSDSKTYDGTPLTAGGSVSGLVDGETVTLTMTGSQTAVGSSSNTYTLTWDGTAKASNYTVTEALGTLTVSERRGGGGGGGGGTGGNNNNNNNNDNNNEPVVDIDEPDVPLVDVPDVDVPQTETPEELVEVPEEDVPLADVPKTGDNTGLWRMAALMSAAGLAVLTALERRQRREE